MRHSYSWMTQAILLIGNDTGVIFSILKYFYNAEREGEFSIYSKRTFFKMDNPSMY